MRIDLPKSESLLVNGSILIASDGRSIDMGEYGQADLVLVLDVDGRCDIIKNRYGQRMKAV